jgi:hypothetical protein
MVAREREYSPIKRDPEVNGAAADVTILAGLQESHEARWSGLRAGRVVTASAELSSKIRYAARNRPDRPALTAWAAPILRRMAAARRHAPVDFAASRRRDAPSTNSGSRDR